MKNHKNPKRNRHTERNKTKRQIWKPNSTDSYQVHTSNTTGGTTQPMSGGATILSSESTRSSVYQCCGPLNRDRVWYEARLYTAHDTTFFEFHLWSPAGPTQTTTMSLRVCQTLTSLVCTYVRHSLFFCARGFLFWWKTWSLGTLAPLNTHYI